MSCQKNRRDKSSVELADVFRMHGKQYCLNNILTPEQYKVMHAIENCRTPILGGHIEECDVCGAQHISYNSCRNRHCPKCQAFRTFQWLESRQKELLPVQYFHVVFTLPHEFNTLVLYNKKVLYDLLFQSAWKTLKTLGKDPKRLNGLMGMIAILHTWGQNIFQHNHVHCIVPGGALVDGIVNGKRWKSSRKNFLFPVKVLSRLFRGIYISKLRVLYKNNQLKFPNDKENFNLLLNSLMKKDWVVYTKEPFAGPEKLLDYLGRYTHKIAISNNRILDCNENFVSFKWRDYADNSKEKIMKLSPDEFIRRFMSHVVPKGFIRIRFFGFLANACKAKNIESIRKLLSHHPKKTKKQKDVLSLIRELTGIDISVCPTCKKGKLHVIKTIPSKFSNIIFDTS